MFFNVFALSVITGVKINKRHLSDIKKDAYFYKTPVLNFEDNINRNALTIEAEREFEIICICTICI